MGLLPLIVSTLSIFVTIISIILLASFITYKIKSPKKRPYLETQPIPVTNPVYIQKISNHVDKIDQEVNYYENVKRMSNKHSVQTERFQVLNFQRTGLSTNFSNYK